MCGIVCYHGPHPAASVLLRGLRRLEYRGYDSSGVALFNGDGIECLRSVGKIASLERKLTELPWKSGCGIAHTRWATHGKPTLENAHPHSDCKRRVYVVHNGIVENYQSLGEELRSRGHVLRSETDTEILAHLIEECLNGSLEKAVAKALERVEGAFGIGVISTNHPETVVVARRGSPLILGIGEEELFAASDVAALVNHTKQVVYLEDDDIAVLKPNEYQISSLGSRRIQRETCLIDWDVKAAEKKHYPHFMLKEIFEQPESVRATFRGRVVPEQGISKLGGLESVLDQMREMDRLIIVSCGTSYYAGMLGRYMLEECTNLAVEVDLASEFRYRSLSLRPGTGVLAISQSGETADTLAAVQEAKRKGALALGMVNVVGSNIARETQAGIYNHAGPEIGVASTKAFTSQVTILLLITLMIARHQRMSHSEGRAFLDELEEIPDKIARILDQSSKIEEIAGRYIEYRNFLFLGRRMNYPIALEGALKLKEISYMHAEAYAAGEMKHGPIALIDETFPSICVAPRDSTYQKMLSNIEEIRARGGPVIAVATEGDVQIRGSCDDLITIPAAGEIFNPLLTVIPLQLFSYYVASQKGCEVDQPRNLAKSVTVE